jgi:hypothetical protein
MNIFAMIFKYKDRYIKSLEEHIERLEFAQQADEEHMLFKLINPQWVKEFDWKFIYKYGPHLDYGAVMNLTPSSTPSAEIIWQSRIRDGSFNTHKSLDEALMYVEGKLLEEMKEMLKKEKR